MSEHKGTFIPFTEDDLDAVWSAYKRYLLEILNREYDVEDAIADLQSLIGSEFDPRCNKVD
jgi:hypothetical protein